MKVGKWRNRAFGRSPPNGEVVCVKSAKMAWYSAVTLACLFNLKAGLVGVVCNQAGT
ncbi:hypothetical protein [Mesorhizobium sp.]|uniref:hypothetical protein n=1 Tax=Mesorhizobium sp. TaxID=1871066 RepID=UPI0025839CAF|nr:hypothetical protein [Mesorhizobium sp.]